jgi:cytochrome b
MRRNLQRLHALAAWLLVAGILVQTFLAGMALASLGGSGDFSLHVEMGYTVIGLLALALVVTAVVAGVRRRDALFSLGLLALYFVQTALPGLRDTLAPAAALHPVLALAMFALALWYARRTLAMINTGQPLEEGTP